jgi:hypothetical protein
VEETGDPDAAPFELAGPVGGAEQVAGAQVVLNGRSFVFSSESGPISDRGTFSASATISMKRPVPPAHLSFITKSATWPSASTRMPLLSCPPTSRIVETPGTNHCAPRQWQLISVIERFAKGTTARERRGLSRRAAASSAGGGLDLASPRRFSS